MPDIVQNVIVDFQVDYSQLTKATEQLAKSGKIDDAGFKQIQAAISTTATDTKGLITQFKNVATSATKMGKSVEDAFGVGIQDALDEAGVSAEDFAKALTKANAPTKTLKAQMLELKNALAQMKAEGKDTGVEFDNLRAKAGKLQDAINDANAEIKNAGSDTRGLDNVIGSISALAGGFAAVQGAAALFGDDSEDLQKTLVKVNASMALATGIQQFYNATLKEGSLAKLADTIATNGQIAVQRIYTFVTGQSTAATTGFKVALAATGIGLFVVGVLALVNALQESNTQLEDTNKLIEQQNNLTELNNQSIQRNIELRSAQAKAAGAAESELIRIRGKGLVQQRDELSETQKLLVARQELAKQKDAAKQVAETFRSLSSSGKDASDSFNKLNEEIEKNTNTLDDLNNQIRITKIELDAALVSENKERIKKAEEANKKLKELRDKAAREAREARISQLNDELSAIERQLLTVEKGSQDEVDLRKKVVGKKSEIDLQAEKLTANKIALIKETALNDQLELQRAFNEKATATQLEDQISTNKAILDLLNVSSQERLQLTIENIEAGAQLEINAAKGNAAKIIEIEGKKYADIRSVKLAALRQQQADELQGNALNRSIIIDALKKVAADRKLSAANRIGAIKGIEIQELASLQKEVDANQQAFDKKLISTDTYNREVKRLADERVKIELSTAAAIAEVNDQTVEDQKERILKLADITLQIASQIGAIFSQLAQQQTDLDNQRISARRQELADLKESGAISQKEFEARSKQLEAMEKQARQRQAQREKNAALFEAALAIPKAFLEGLTKGGPLLASVYAALAAVQAALIASRPIPKFFRGKQGNYQGPGEVADMGAELVERNGRMFLYTKPSTTYLAAKDKVYTASQTRAMLHNTDVSRLTVTNNNNGMAIDYAKMGAAIPKSSININIDKDFISESVADGLSKTNYMGRRYRWK